MLTRIEIDGFKTFENFALDLEPLTAIFGPNASGKSNLFDALRFLSLIAQGDIRTVMQGLRGEPEELFRRTSTSEAKRMIFAAEVFIEKSGIDEFGTKYETPAQRLRYELEIGISYDKSGSPKGIFVLRELCRAISKQEDRALYLRNRKPRINYNARVSPFIRKSEGDDALEVRQDGRTRHGRPVRLPLSEASRTALSTISPAEFPHLHALRKVLLNIRFLEISPVSARSSNDRFESKTLIPTSLESDS